MDFPPTFSERQQGKVIIVCAKREETNVRRSLAGLIHATAERDQSVRIIAIPDSLCHDKHFVTAAITAQLPPGDPHLLVPTQIAANFEMLSSSAYLRRPNGIHTLLRRDLPRLLQQLRLDWISHLEDILRNGWHHGPLDRHHIDRWIQQFEHCGSHRWVAEGLLKSLDFWSDIRTREALRILPEALVGFDSISVNRHAKAGKSADVIANLVRKQLDTLASLNRVRLLDFREALSTPHINRILYVEDCILSGNEMERIFRGLMGLPDPYGSPKAAPLDNPELLKSKQVVLRFAVVGNGGLEHIRRFLLRYGLESIHVDTETSQIVPMLTEEGLSALMEDTLYNEEDNLRYPDQYMKRSAFQFWPDPEKQGRAKRFCERIGRQLYACYLETQGKHKPDRWVEECALGIRSAALTLAFGHSIPKETLPLFWTQGIIRWQNRPFYWYPLFDNAG